MIQEIVNKKKNAPLKIKKIYKWEKERFDIKTIEYSYSSYQPFRFDYYFILLFLCKPETLPEVSDNESLSVLRKEESI